MQIKKIFLILLVLFSFSSIGCVQKEELVGNLDIHQSVEILVALKNSGVIAEQERSSSSKGDKYQVVVVKNDYQKALEVLREYNLPKNEDESFNQLTNSNSFTPNIKEISDLRLDKSIALEAERLIRSLTNTVDAKVIVRANLVADNSFSNSQQSKASATAVIKYSKLEDENRQAYENRIRSILLQVVPGIINENININLIKVKIENGLEYGFLDDEKVEAVPLTQVAPFPLVVPMQDKDRVRLFLAILMSIFAIVGILIGYITSTLFKKTKHKHKRMNYTAILEANIKPQGLMENMGNPQDRDKFLK
ncbi:MAG: hypothetical protein KBC84_07545 [Proteobacteria bacterium]|nr:hypothetical protein [Pseudomonadota bacterium]